jgi:putative acetyltransferase
MLEISIESPTKNDYPAIAKLVNETTKASFVGYYHPAVIEQKASFTEQSIADRVEAGAYFVARVNEGAIVGVVGLVEGELKTFFVDSAYQGRGLGIRLYNHIEAEAISQKLNKIFLKSSIPAIPFYQELGFKIVDKYQKEAVGYSYKSTLMEKNL